MTIKQFTGWLILSMPFIALFVFVVIKEGFIPAILVHLILAILVGMIALGVNLVMDD